VARRQVCQLKKLFCSLRNAFRGLRRRERQQNLAFGASRREREVTDRETGRKIWLPRRNILTLHLLLPASSSGLRKVYPYYFTFTTFTKGRWVGEKILEVFGREFRAHPVEEYVRSRMQINEAGETLLTRAGAVYLGRHVNRELRASGHGVQAET